MPAPPRPYRGPSSHSTHLTCSLNADLGSPGVAGGVMSAAVYSLNFRLELPRVLTPATSPSCPFHRCATFRGLSMAGPVGGTPLPT
jgi:hypothetical protein